MQAMDDLLPEDALKRWNSLAKIVLDLHDTYWSAPTKDTTSYVRVKDILVSGAGGR